MGRGVTKGEKGAAMVELAIILPLLLVVLFGVMEMGFILYDKVLITNASREGARAGIVYRANVTTGCYQPYTAAEIQGVVNAYLNQGNNLIPPAQPAITIPEGICTGTAFPLRVRVAYAYSFFLLPNLVTSITGPLTLSGESVMRCE
ncbi:MAG: TadE/TadG family type IV pilus assembly protein [Thermodesulfobacteriota bacterium]